LTPISVVLALCCLQGADGQQPANPPADAQQPAKPPADEGLLKKGSFPRSYLLPGTDVSVKVGGYLKVDVVHDFDAIGKDDAFDPRTIPTDGTKGENTLIQAKQSRLNLDVRTPTDLGPARLFLEVDFFNDSTTLRLRHAYVTLGNLLAGQTWSTFMDEDAMPPTLDFEEPVAYATVRVPQVRWTQPLSDETYIAFAIESPDSEIDTMPVAGTSENPFPDLTSRFRWTFDGGHLQASAYMGWAQFRPDVGSVDQALLWGFLVAGAVKTWEKDEVQFQLAYGKGLGRYRGGLVAGPDLNGNLQSIPVVAAMVDYRHYWTPTWSTNAVYSIAHASPTDGEGPGTLKNTQYAAINLVWDFLSWASAGVEYLYGTREDRDESRGSANRIMFSVKFLLP
jgi:hypothetical protein